MLHLQIVFFYAIFLLPDFFADFFMHLFRSGQLVCLFVCLFSSTPTKMPKQRIELNFQLNSMRFFLFFFFHSFVLFSCMSVRLSALPVVCFNFIQNFIHVGFVFPSVCPSVCKNACNICYLLNNRGERHEYILEFLYLVRSFLWYCSFIQAAAIVCGTFVELNFSFIENLKNSFEFVLEEKMQQNYLNIYSKTLRTLRFKSTKIKSNYIRRN